MVIFTSSLTCLHGGVVAGAGVARAGYPSGGGAGGGDSAPSGLLLDIILLRVPPLNMALTSSQLCTTSSGGSPSSRMWRRHELKLAASGCTYFPPSASRCEWNTN